jgi:hypothetical protein
MLAITAISAGTVAAVAASGDTVYVKVNNGWSNLHCYMWNSDSDKNATWPGIAMTKVTDDVYAYTLSGNYGNIIFNTGNGGSQTADMVYPGANKIYDLNAGSWSDYTGNTIVTNPTTPTTGGDGTTVYCDNDANWSTVYCYMWNSDSDKNATWPGVAMTADGNGNFVYTASKTFANCIFNAGNGGAQTADLTAKHGFMYNNATGAWSEYNVGPTKPTTSVPTNPTNPGEGTVVYLKNTANWSTVNCYMWNSESDKNGTWPGVAMTSVGDGVFMYQASKVYASCIFNNGSTQTADLTAKNGYIYDNSTGQWTEYDTSPIKVKSFSADPASDVYTGTTVTLSADATSSEGAVAYKITVTDAAGVTSILSNFSTNKTATWTPAAVGTYTINFDFKDAANNTNNRKVTINVQDDSKLVKPVIKTVLPANLNLIQINTKATVTVTAGGGKTGTNLLFYKYVVTNPNGKKNTPYYTLNNTYSFTPDVAGTYTVDVYVQGSDNATVNKTYTYTTTNSPVTQPTSSVVITKGDANGDGNVNISDVTHIQRYSADYSGYKVDVDVADMNNDGVVNVKDATYLQRVLAKIA